MISTLKGSTMQARAFIWIFLLFPSSAFVSYALKSDLNTLSLLSSYNQMSK